MRVCDPRAYVGVPGGGVDANYVYGRIGVGASEAVTTDGDIDL
jgi:hypothetical protein